MKGTFIVNDREQRWEFPPAERLLLTLRRHGYTEVKNGCEEGECGACLILLDGKLINSCQVFTATAIDTEITTVKGIGDLHNPHPLQKAFVETGAVQCGFCSPGFIVASYSILKDNPNASMDEIKDGLNGNLCRCTGYVKILEAIELAAESMRENQHTISETKPERTRRIPQPIR
jgi:aerobic-type carbon monoxide dehydrogenase small subunit (CoxS/CutS family)